MERPFKIANLGWLIQANIVRFELLLKGVMTALQRQTMERLLAEQRANLEALDRPDKPE
jgi:hypothetical protein